MKCHRLLTTAAMNLGSGLPRREEPMDRNIVSEPLYPAEQPDLQRKSPAWSVGAAAFALEYVGWDRETVILTPMFENYVL